MAKEEIKKLVWIKEEIKEIFGFTAPEDIYWKIKVKIFPVINDMIEDLEDISK